MGNPVVHWELWSKDPQKASDFYARVFDWKIQHVPEMDYRMAESAGQGGVGEFSLFADPDGRVMGLWKQGAK